MKLLVQGDDFGFTKGVTYGIIEAIDNGIITTSGMFTNMPIASWAAKFIKERPDFCFGIDFNIVSGPSVCDPKEIPHLVDENGEFIRSGVRTRDPRFKTLEGRLEMFPYEECYKELRAQYDKFVELTGHIPGYLHGHSLMHENYTKAMEQISIETGVGISSDLLKKVNAVSTADKIGFSGMKKEFNPIAQLEKKPFEPIKEYSDYLLGSDYASVICHPGYVDADLLNLTTLSLERCKDLDLYLSKEFKDWIIDNNVELISYYDLGNRRR